MNAWGDLVCVNTADGKEVWRKNLHKDFAGVVPTFWGYAESPLVDGDKVLVTPGGGDGAVLALNKKTGERIWQTKGFYDQANYASIIPSDIGRRASIRPAHSRQSLVGVSAQDGAILWKANRHGDTAVIPTPLVNGNEVYVTSGYGAGCSLFKVSAADGKFSVEQVYAKSTSWGQSPRRRSLGRRLHLRLFRQQRTDVSKRGNRRVNLGRKIRDQKRFRDLCRRQTLLPRRRFRRRRPCQRHRERLHEEKGRLKQPGPLQRTRVAPTPVIANAKLYLRDRGNQILCYNLKSP